MIATTYKSVRREPMTPTEPTAPVTPPVAPEATPPTVPPASDPPAERTVPYARFQEVNTKLRGMETQLAELTTKATSADDMAAKVASLSAELLRTRVATAKGVPPELAGMLSGKDEAELTASADVLMKFVKAQATAPNIDGSTPSVPLPTFTLAQISDPTFYRANRDAILAAQRDGRITD